MRKLLKASICLLAPCLFALGAAPAASAQDVVDPIGSLLDQIDEETAETRGVPPEAAAPPPAPQPPPSLAQPTFPYGGVRTPHAAPAPPALPPSVSSGSPVNVDDYDRTPERPLNAVELNYENRLRASFASAQGMQGPMDGGWTLSTREGAKLYALLLVDKNQASLEGAWRDLRRPGVGEASGFFSDIQRIGGQLTASFYPGAGRGAAGLSLQAASNGEWTGDLTEGGRRTPVVLRRD